MAILWRVIIFFKANKVNLANFPYLLLEEVQCYHATQLLDPPTTQPGPASSPSGRQAARRRPD